MPFIQLHDKQYPLRVGEVRVGSGPDAHVPLPGADAVHAIVELTADSHAAIRRATETAVVRVNGVQLGAEPTPLIHGDKIELGGHELLFADDKKGGSTQMVSSADLAALKERVGAGKPMKPTAATGGRLVSLVDGREYAVRDGGIVIGRDAGCDVVVPSTEVSRRHAEIRPSPSGYLLSDTSTNGVFVNGQRVAQSQTLGRADVLRIGNEEFRFYADVAPAAAPSQGAAAQAAPPAAPAASPVKAPPAPAPQTPAAASLAAAGASAASTPPSVPTVPPRAAPAAAPAPAAPAAAPQSPRAPAAPARPVLATLEVVNEGVLKGTRFDLRAALSHVGRGPHNDVVITDDSVSDSHAKLQKREAGWYVVDMGSTNGTYVGGRRINGEALLAGAPDVRFGGVKLVFRASGDAADDAKGTRAIAGVTADQARRMREASQPRASAAPAPAPAEPVPASRGIPAWVWIVALLLAAAVGFFILQGR